MYDAETLTRIFKTDDFRVLFAIGVICQVTGLSADRFLMALVNAGKKIGAEASELNSVLC